MQNVKYIDLSEENFKLNSLDGFVRRQHVKECWRPVNGKLRLMPVEYTEDWTLPQKRAMALSVLQGIKNGDKAVAAVYGKEIVGFAYIKKQLFGSRGQYADLAEFYVSAPYRRKGIGERLFKSACSAAKNFGAEKLYISAHSAKESMSAYYKYGCVPAEEINLYLAEKEPCDVQLEFKLK